MALNYLYTFLCLIHFVISSVITENKTKLKRVYIFKLIDKWHVQKKKKKKNHYPRRQEIGEKKERVCRQIEST